MKYLNANNVTLEGHDFTEEFIENFSRIALCFGMDNGMFGKGRHVHAGEAAASNDQYFLQFMPSKEVIGAIEITVDQAGSLLASVNFFAADELRGRPSVGSFEGYAAIAFLRFRFDILAKGFIERRLSDAEIYVRDGWADTMFVAMIEADNPMAFAA